MYKMSMLKVSKKKKKKKDKTIYKVAASEREEERKVCLQGNVVFFPPRTCSGDHDLT